MWKALVAQFYPDHTSNPGTTDRDIARAETTLGVALPPDLRELLIESNGIADDGPGLGLIWPLDDIVSRNLAMRTDFRDTFMPFEPLLFFGDAGNGDQFAFAVISGVATGRGLFSWNHEDDSRCWVAPDLRHYLEWWSDGRITT